MHNRSMAILIFLSLLLGACAPLTKEEKVMRAVRQTNSQSEADSPEECTKILERQPWCTVTKSVKRIERPEWIALFPSTEFYLAAYDLIGRESQQSHNLLFIEQDGRRYYVETFDNLLDANQIAITDQNRELVGKAFALMTLADYLDQEIVFTDWQSGKWEGRHTFDHYLKAWTKIQGIEFWWWFTFEDDQLKYTVRDGVASADYHRGDYIDVSFGSLPLPPLLEYSFTNR